MYEREPVKAEVESWNAAAQLVWRRSMLVRSEAPKHWQLAAGLAGRSRVFAVADNYRQKATEVRERCELAEVVEGIAE